MKQQQQQQQKHTMKMRLKLNDDTDLNLKSVFRCLISPWVNWGFSLALTVCVLRAHINVSSLFVN